MKPGEIVEGGPSGASGFGLSVAVLSQLLHAPRLPYPSELMAEEDEQSMFKKSNPNNGLDYAAGSVVDPIDTSPLSPTLTPSTLSLVSPIPTGKKDTRLSLTPVCSIYV